VLQVTSTAVSVLTEARQAQQLPEEYGVRVFAHADESGQAALALAFAEQPAEDDQVTEQDGTEIYVAPELAEPLAGSTLDVTDGPNGPELTLVPQDDEQQ
jgi:Fe-S cluster assembly iron-binding protein IscA